MSLENKESEWNSLILQEAKDPNASNNTRRVDDYKEGRKSSIHPSNKTANNSKIFYINEDARLRMLRHYLKERKAISDKNSTANEMEKGANLLKKGIKSELLLDINKTILDKLKNQRKHTEAVVQQTLSRSKSLVQQIGQPLRQIEEIRLKEQSMKTLFEELKK